MLTDVGEFLVGAYLQLVEKCDVVDYNVRPPGGGLAGLEELDVLGLSFASNTVFLCEVTTHIGGLLYKDNAATVDRVRKKYERQQAYASKYLKNFSRHRFQFWSPVVPDGYQTQHLGAITGLELVINGEYKKRVDELVALGGSTMHDARNPVFRVLQILGHLRD